MRLLGHPVHVMLVHFPVALWPAHAGLQLFAAWLPAGAAVTVGFWLLAAGTALGWLAAIFGLTDLADLWAENDPSRLTAGIVHALVNGTALLGFTAILVLEYRVYPTIQHGAAFLAAEAVLLAAMFAGNYFGGAVIWRQPSRAL